MPSKRRLRLFLPLHRAIHQIGAHMTAAVRPPVTHGEAAVLGYLHECDGSAMSTLHRAFALRKSTLTSIVNRLVAGGLAARATIPSDRRSVIVRLTAKGSAAASSIYKNLLALEDASLRGSSESDVQAMTDVLANLGEHPVAQHARRKQKEHVHR